MKFFRITPAETLRRTIQEVFGFTELSAEEAPLADCCGRILAKDLLAPEDLPACDRSQVDGYALLSASSTGASESIPAPFRLAGSVKMGEAANIPVTADTCICVPTGAMMPAGADCAAKIEDCEELPDGSIAVMRPLAPGENVLRKGEDIAAGSVLLPKGTRIAPKHVAPLSALGIKTLPLVRKPRYAVISTGDEIVAEGVPPGIAGIRDSNGPTLAALAESIGGTITGIVLVNDAPGALDAALARALESADCVLVSGGSSVGERDQTRLAIESLSGSRILAHGVGMKPGKPALVAVTGAGKAVFGLPGHPASAAAVFLALVSVYHETATGQKRGFAHSVAATLSGSVHAAPGMETWQPCALAQQDGKLIATPLFGRSGSVSLFALADGFLVLPPDAEGAEAGSSVTVRLFY